MERVARGERRARFAGTRLGSPSDEARRHAPRLAAGLLEMESLGLAPVLEDGAVAGNGALRLASGTWIVSASGRRAGDPAIVEVVSFDAASFSVAYRSDEGREPSSDVALHAAGMAAGAGATLHGHALASAADAMRLGLPISRDETPFGTPEDLAAMQALMHEAPYPTHGAWIRRGHGFFVAAETLEDARARVRRLVEVR